ncbi:ROK family protein [Paenibacillus piri]|uniref:ROK family protein n=1 Tax=Paenibacillus piri TaxID=2547395 RepID=A0A4R5KQE2_9BACL|nr:ROK family protein [Paenibacillus piri]TDF97225.1 ROK family protein [Paenibacillus piri]
MYTIGVDLGGTQIRAGLFDPAGKLLVKAEALTLANEGAEAVIGRMKESIYEVIRHVEGSISGNIAGIGIGSPGPLNPFTGVVLSPSTLPGMIDIPLRTIMTDEFRVPVYVNNDANAAALGEWLYGSGQHTNNLLYVTISTGIGAGIVVDGKLLLGEQGSAGEIGHMIIDPNGPLCSCGNRGCWEACASGTGIVERTKQKLERCDETQPYSRLQLCRTQELTAKDVFAAAMRYDALAMEIIEETRMYLGIGLINLINLYNPQKIVFGGGVSKAGDFLLKQPIEMAQQRSLLGMRDVQFSMAALGENVGLYGAAALVSYEQRNK